jgi:hypothetical protein
MAIAFNFSKPPAYAEAREYILLCIPFTQRKYTFFSRVCLSAEVIEAHTLERAKLIV